MDDVDERVSLLDSGDVFLALFLVGRGIQLAGCQIFHSLIWSGDEQDCTAKSRCFEIYQTSV